MECRRTLRCVLDHIQYEAEIYDVGRMFWRVRPECRIPAATRHALVDEVVDVVAMAAAVVKNRHRRLDEPMQQRRFHRA